MDPGLEDQQELLQGGLATPQLLLASSVYSNVKTLTLESEQVGVVHVFKDENVVSGPVTGVVAIFKR